MDLLFFLIVPNITYGVTVYTKVHKSIRLYTDRSRWEFYDIGVIKLYNFVNNKLRQRLISNYITKNTREF